MRCASLATVYFVGEILERSKSKLVF
uniref:Uncharacterized protein n=1 Tax=Arundo donax TaxID=35708 RepID=A0A0A9A3E3_ARUDO